MKSQNQFLVGACGAGTDRFAAYIFFSTEDCLIRIILFKDGFSWGGWYSHIWSNGDVPL